MCTRIQTRYLILCVVNLCITSIVAPDRPTLLPPALIVGTEAESETLTWNLIAFPDDHGVIQ